MNRSNNAIINILAVMLTVYTSLSFASDKTVMTVSVTHPKIESENSQISASGYISAWQTAAISSEVDGLKITTLNADIGDHVRKGQLLAQMNKDVVSADLHKYQAVLVSAKAAYEQAKANADRARGLRSSGAMSRQEISSNISNEKMADAAVQVAAAQVESQKILVKHTDIFAIDDGVITERNAMLGQVVSVGTELFKMQRQGKLEWISEVDAALIKNIHFGNKVKINLDQSESIIGVVSKISPVTNNNTGRVNVHVTIESEKIKSGMFLSGEIFTGKNSAMTIPFSSIVFKNGNHYAFTVKNDLNKNIVSMVKIAIGQQHNDEIEIKNGLSESDNIVIEGGSFLNDGDLVNVYK